MNVAGPRRSSAAPPCSVWVHMDPKCQGVYISITCTRKRSAMKLQDVSPLIPDQTGAKSICVYNNVMTSVDSRPALLHPPKPG